MTEPGRLTPRPVFTGMRLDRASDERREPAWVQEQRHHPAARGVLSAGDAVQLDRGGAALRRVVPFKPAPEDILVGLEEGVPLFARDLGAEQPSREFISLREAGVTLEAGEAGLAACVLGLVNWHRRHPFCAACGARSEPDQGGYARRCPRCGALHFPRTDPAVIMLVHDGSRILLGRRAGWPQRRMSVLAGFVSPGESLEEAVIREVWEESGIVAGEPRFIASQPWPFPASLMLGFTARAEGGEPSARDGELAEVRWVAGDEVAAALAGENPALVLPPPVSIARLLIELWFRGALP